MKVAETNLPMEEVVRQLVDEDKDVVIQLAQLPLKQPRYLGWEDKKGLCHVLVAPDNPRLEEIRRAAWVDLQPHFKLSVPCFLFHGDTEDAKKTIEEIKAREAEPPIPVREKVVVRNPKGRR